MACHFIQKCQALIFGCLQRAHLGRTSFADTFNQSGTYEFQTIIPELGSEGQSKVRVEVTQRLVEKDSLQIEKGTLEDIATLTGGSFHLITTADSIPDRIIDLSRDEVSISRRGVWDTYYAILLAAAFLTLEWIIRKRLGYV